MIERYDERRKDKKKSKNSISLENGGFVEVDFENDPDWALLLEYQDELFDPNGDFIFNKKIIKNWKYFTQEITDFEFYMDKAKYILKTYDHNKEEIENMKKGQHLRKMSYVMLTTVPDNMRFMEKCMQTHLAQYSMYLEMLYQRGMSFAGLSETTGEAKSSIQIKAEKGIRQIARLLVAKDKFESIGETMFKNAVDLGVHEKEVELNEKLELVGVLATALKIQLESLNKEDKKDVYRRKRQCCKSFCKSCLGGRWNTYVHLDPSVY